MNATLRATFQSSSESDEDFAKRMLRVAFQTAAAESLDPSTQNGAVLVGSHGMVIGVGANSFARGLTVTPERLADRDQKMACTQHAERKAILMAARTGEATQDSVLYCTWFACADCALAILDAGITKCVGHQEMFDRTPDRWRASVDTGLNHLREGGVEVQLVSAHFGDITVRMNGEEWLP
jgi:dCMP deaminase